MRVSRQIHEECVDLCRRENDFVCVTSNRPLTLESFIWDHHLKLVTRWAGAQSSWNIAMTIVLDHGEHTHTRYCLDVCENERPRKFIFTSDELPRLCQFWMKEKYLERVAIYIDINDAKWNGHSTEIDRHPAGLSKLRRLLEPLDLLRGIGAAQIEGPLSSSYKLGVIESLCRGQPTGMDTLQCAIATFIKGDEKLRQNDSSSASELYKKALNYVHSCNWLSVSAWPWHEEETVLDNGLFSGLKAGQAIFNLRITLFARIAAIYLENWMLRMARIYIERAFDLRRPYFREGFKHWEELNLRDSSEVPVFAEVLHVSAQVSHRQGDVRNAAHDLGRAENYQPLDEEQKCRLKTWKDHIASLDQRKTERADAADLRYQKKLREQIESSRTLTRTCIFLSKQY